MILYKNSHTDPYFNLAAEEVLLDLGSDAVMLWRNGPSVILGRSQNAYAELDRDFVERNCIRVVRRLSGGGAVFHDLGNINFTFIVADDGSPIDFGRFTGPVTAALAKLGVAAELSGRNDLTVGGCKISGNAQCRRNGRLLHHGTLLYSASLDFLAGALRVDTEKLRSKGIASVRSRVGNLRELADLSLSPEAFLSFLETELSRGAEATIPLTGDLESRIQSLADSKYSGWSWNWGESKAFDRTRRRRFPFGTVEISVSASHGLVTDLRITGDFFAIADLPPLEQALIGSPLTPQALTPTLKQVAAAIPGADAEELVNLIL